MPLILPKRNLSAYLSLYNEKLLWISCSILLFLVYITHIGTLPLDITTDEPRRALVSLEMMLSGNYAVPTLNGEMYLNKPPVYNWIIIGFVRLFGDYSMFAFRLPLIISLASLGIAVFYFTQKFTNGIVAFFTAFAFCTNGRILIYDSFQGLIDTFFSLIVYLNFMLIFWYGEKEKLNKLFLYSYLLAAIGFLTKGFPIVVFQGVTLATYFIISKKFKSLFSAWHLYGLLLFVIITGSYYLIYFTSASLSPQTLFNNLFYESSRRTLVEQGLQRSLLHLVTFPFEFIYHFAPWTIFIVVLFNKSIVKKIRDNRFIFYSLAIFLSNILVYWFSPEVYPRYLFMFLPLLFSVLFFLFFKLHQSAWQVTFINKFVLVFSVLAFSACLLFPFLSLSDKIAFAGFKAAVIATLLFLCFTLALMNKNHLMYAFALSLVVCRFGFNLFVLDQRGESNRLAQHTSLKIAEITKGQPLYLDRRAEFDNFDGMSFHISKARKEILRYSDSIEPGSFFITDNRNFDKKEMNTLLVFNNNAAQNLRLVQAK